MEMITNLNDQSQMPVISARHIRLYQGLATGLSLTEAARQANYSIPYACHLVRSDEGRLAIANLRNNIELLLAQELEGMIAQAVDILKGQLHSHFIDHRVRAAEFILKHLGKVLIEAVPTNSENFTAINPGEIHIGNSQKPLTK